MDRPLPVFSHRYTAYLADLRKHWAHEGRRVGRTKAERAGGWSGYAAPPAPRAARE